MASDIFINECYAEIARMEEEIIRVKLLTKYLKGEESLDNAQDVARERTKQSIEMMEKTTNFITKNTESITSQE